MHVPKSGLGCSKHDFYYLVIHTRAFHFASLAHKLFLGVKNQLDLHCN
jgi:hypothetical protein